MEMGILAVLTLVMGIYILYKSDSVKESYAKTTYAFAGLVATLWAVIQVFNGYGPSLGILPLAFGFFAIGSMHSKGLTQAVFGAAAILVFLNLVM